MILVSVWKYFLLLENFFRISPPGQQGHLGRLSAGAGVSSVSALRTRQVSSSAEAGAAADGHGDTFLQTRQPRTWQPEQHCGMATSSRGNIGNCDVTSDMSMQTTRDGGSWCKHTYMGSFLLWHNITYCDLECACDGSV